jgi:hypothetical protein
VFDGVARWLGSLGGLGESLSLYLGIGGVQKLEKLKNHPNPYHPSHQQVSSRSLVERVESTE